MCWLGCKCQSHWYKDDSYSQTFAGNEIILHHTCQSLPFCILWKTPLTALALGNFQDVKVCLHSKSAFVEIAQEGFFWPSSMYSTSVTLGGAYSPWLLSTGRCCDTIWGDGQWWCFVADSQGHVICIFKKCHLDPDFLIFGHVIGVCIEEERR